MIMRILAAFVAGGIGAAVPLALLPPPSADSAAGIGRLPAPTADDVEISSHVTPSRILRIGGPAYAYADFRSTDGRLGRIEIEGYCTRWNSLQIGGIHDVRWTTWRRPDGSIITTASDTGDIEQAYCS